MFFVQTNLTKSDQIGDHSVRSDLEGVAAVCKKVVVLSIAIESTEGQISVVLYGTTPGYTNRFMCLGLDR